MGERSREDLEREVEKLRKINAALMARVERDMELQKGGLSLFQAAVTLETKVRERTRALEKSNDELKVAKDAADAASKSKSEFLATMSHEIRTPMNGVLGTTELLELTELTSPQRQHVHTIRRSAEALLTIINDILDFSKIEAGRLQLENIEFDLRDLVEDTVELIAEPAHAKSLELACHLPSSIAPRFKGDPGRIRQVLTNLVGNAVKFTPKGWIHVEISSSPIADGRVELRFTITDTGIGIPHEVLPTLFQAFTQADGSMARRYGATGLGLAIVRHLCELMGGACGVESKVDGGSTFWFTAQVEVADAASATAPASLRGRHALLLEDCPATRALVSDMLASSGMSVTTAADAADIRAGARFDVCFVSPRAGQSVASRIHRELARSGVLADTPVVRIAPAREAATQDAWSGYVTKPVRKARLVAAAAAACGAGPGGEKASQDRMPMSVGRTAGLHVLLVEDNEINREVATGMLDQLGCTWKISTNGREACDAVAAETFDLVLMDCQMPEMDGFDATRAVRRFESERRVPRMRIVALTANALPGDRARCIEAGMDGFLSKPFLIAELRDVLTGAPRVSKGRPAGAAPILCREALAQVRALQRPGRPDLVTRLLTMFVRTAAPQIANLVEAASANDIERVRHVAHTLKSSSANVGVKRLAEAFAAVEKAAREGRIEPALIERLRDEHAEAETAIRAEIASQVTGEIAHVQS